MILLVRHASAGDREAWQGDDRVRPLDERGGRQSEALVERLASFRLERILSSPYLRCVQTVEPLAAHLGIELELRDELGEDGGPGDGAALVALLAREGGSGDVAVCGHGGLDGLVVAEQAPKWKKGAVFVLDDDLRLIDAFRV